MRFFLAFLLLFSGQSFGQETLFITGIGGFIGFHTAMEAQRRGYAVVGIDNFNDYYDPALKKARASLLSNQGIEVIEADLCDQVRMEEIFNSNEFDGIIHLAAQAGVRASFEIPKTYIDSNIVGTWLLLELNRKKKIPMIAASSSSVYGDQGPFPSAESNSTDAPLSLYAATKKAVEAISHSYHSMYGIPITCLRFFSVYGPWGRPDMAYYGFSKKILQGIPISLYGGGALLRDLTYIDDIVSGIFLSLDKIEGFHIYNLGCSRPHTTIEIVAEIERYLGLSAQVVLTDKPGGDAIKTHADISKAQSELGYQPKVFLSEGIGKFLSWLQEYEPELFQ